MRVIIKNAYVYRNDIRDFCFADILCENGSIVDVGNNFMEMDGDMQSFDVEGMAVFPGLVDVHTHGRSGADFVSCRNDMLHKMAHDYALHGVTTVMPTLASAPFAEMLSAARRISEFESGEDEAVFCGVHFEGRYLNPQKRGAHAEGMLSPLCADELDSDELRSLKAFHITAAFELDVDASFAKKGIEIGATLALGHTMATFEEARLAEANGVSAYTHLFNAMPPLHHREGGAVTACLIGDSYGEIICDGVHIAPEMVALAYRCKGTDRLSLVSDSMEATGCVDGEYFIAGNPVTVKNGKALTHDGALAGSTLTLDTAVQNLVRFCKIPLTDAVLCATENPAREVGVFEECGSVDIGKRADLIFCDMSDVKKNIFDIKKVMLRGNFIN